jgi:hypothetical protein
MILVYYRPLHCCKDGAIALMMLPLIFPLWYVKIASNICIDCVHNDSGSVTNFQDHLALLNPASKSMLPAIGFTALKKMRLSFDALMAG